MKKYFFALLIVILIIPSITFASWWNPFSWKVFNKNYTSTISNTTSSTNDEQINEVKSSSSIKFDSSVIKSSLMIKILDNGKYISQGSGISLGGLGNILTNYHVAEKVLSDPNRYKAYGCITISLDTTPSCDYLLSPKRKLLSGSITSAQYSKDLDLALLYIDQVKVNGKWLSVINTSLGNLKDRSINLSSYIKNYQDLIIGDSIYSVGYPDYGDEKTIQVDGTVKEIWKDPNTSQMLISSTLNISHGNSGGPVFNSKGELEGVSVKCFTVSSDSEKCKSYSGLFIPLPSVNSWYTQVNNSHIITFEGKNYYSSNNGISDNTQKATLCLLDKNAHYDSNISTNTCTCNTGYNKNTNNECVDNSGTAGSPKTSYGEARDIEGEKKSLQMLDSLFSDLKQNSTQGVSTNMNQQSLAYGTNHMEPATPKGAEAGKYKDLGVNYYKQGNRDEASKYFLLAISIYSEALNIIGNDTPPEDWKKSHDCLVEGLNNLQSSTRNLNLILFSTNTSESYSLLSEAKTLTNQGIANLNCAVSTQPLGSN